MLQFDQGITPTPPQESGFTVPGESRNTATPRAQEELVGGNAVEE